jgi:plastocyanin
MAILSRFVAAAFVAAFALMAAQRAGAAHVAATGAPAHQYLITAGWGNDDYAANIYTPNTLRIYAGDSVTWRMGGLLEPHTISFGPLSLLRNLARNSVQVVPQKAGPPQFVLNSQGAFPTPSHTYTGTGFVNSGILASGQSWTATFPKAGTYHYYCLLHFPGMSGTVQVLPRPAGTTVMSGYGSDRSAVDAYFPENLTIRAGTTVSWSAGFHTVTFAPLSMAQNLRRHMIVPVKGSNGRALLELNAQIVTPSRTTTYAGGYWNSGLLVQGPTHLTFTKPGVYQYHCLIHPGMDGTITVTR